MWARRIVPALILNNTSVETGRRVMVAESSGHAAMLAISGELERCLDEEKYCFDDDRMRLRYANKVKLVLLSITNDPNQAVHTAHPPAARPMCGVHEVLLPVRVSLNARDGHAG